MTVFDALVSASPWRIASESAQLHYAQPYRLCAGAHLDPEPEVPVPECARGAGDYCVGSVHSGVDHRWAGRLPGSTTRADYDAGHAAGSAGRQADGDGG